MSGRKKRVSPGFTLLEVMISVAILALTLTSIFAAEAGTIKAGHRARHTAHATLLARCKMGEIEEQMLKEGLPPEGQTGTDHCCEDAEAEGFSCDWEIQRIILPEAAAPEDAAGGEGGDDEEEGGATGPAGLAGGASIDDLMAGGAIGGGGGDMFAELAMQYTYPLLKPAVEEQVRRAVVTVRWKEGGQEHSFEVKQYIVSEMTPALPDDTGTEEEGGATPPPEP